MKKTSFITRLISAFLILSILITSPAVTYAAETKSENEELARTYISEVRMFYGYSEEDCRKRCEADGFTFCPQNLVEDNFAQGAYSFGTMSGESGLAEYLGYKTTKDAGNAITNLSLLDMKNSHWEETDYETYMDRFMGDFADQACQIMILVNEFRKKYEAGSPAAYMCYDSLNMFYVKEDRSHTDPGNLLGNYILDEADDSFFARYIQRGNAQILATIIGCLAGAAADYDPDGTVTWIDRAKTSAIKKQYEMAGSGDRNYYNQSYGDTADKLLSEIRNLVTTYDTARDLYDRYGETFGYNQTDGITENSSLADLIEEHTDCQIPEYAGAMMLYGLLDQIVYQEAFETVETDAGLLYTDGEGTDVDATVTYAESRTVADVFREYAADGDIALHMEVLYPFIEGMTEPQRAALRLAGLSGLVRTLYPNDNYMAEREAGNLETEQKLIKLGFSDGKIFLWENTDQSVYSKLMVETSDSIEMKYAGKDLKNSENRAAREAVSDLTMALQLVDVGILFISGVCLIVQAFVGTLWGVGTACFFMAASWVAIAGAVTLTAVGYFIGGLVLCALQIINVVALVVSLALLVYSILQMCGVFDEPEYADYSHIPDIVYHAVEKSDGVYSVRYDSVTSNARELYEEAHENYANFVNILFGEIEDIFRDGRDGATPSDYSDLGAYLGLTDRWVTLYSTKAPAAGNPICLSEGGTFFHIENEKPDKPKGTRPLSLMSSGTAENIHAIKIEGGKKRTPAYMYLITDPEAYAAGGYEEIAKAETKDNGQYVTRILLSHAEKETDAKNNLKRSGFLDIIDVNLTPYSGYTYIGYQMGSRQNALTDIRVSSQALPQILYGDASYGLAGDDTYGMTPDGMGLYVSSSPSAGTPIKKIKVVTKRLRLGSGAEPVCLFSGGNAVDFKHKWSDNYYFWMGDYTKTTLIDKGGVKVRQDDVDEGYYIYFWPEEEYEVPEDSGESPYIGGFSYFMSVDRNGDEGEYGTQEEFIRKYASAMGFNLVMSGLSPARMMSEQAGRMNPVYNWKDKEGGALGHDWTYDMYHFMGYSLVGNQNDNGAGHWGITGYCDRAYGHEDVDTVMYFGMSYTYNPYRAITDIAGLITPYTETTHSLRFTGLTTPAGTLQSSTVCIQGNPVTQAGISLGYFGYTNMPSSLYPWSKTRTRTQLSWLPDKDREILSQYLLTNGPVSGKDPLLIDDVFFVTDENPGSYAGYVPLVDLRSPGDYEHPMNLALETTNAGSEYLYMYIRNDAGGRTGEAGDHNVYEKKHYVGAVFLGTGKTPEEAINNLYSKAASSWHDLAQYYSDLPEKPMVREFDEIIPIDLGEENPWYDYTVRNVGSADPSNNHWARGNDAAHKRWGHRELDSSYWHMPDFSQNRGLSDKAPDSFENLTEHAYIGVIRTDDGSQRTVMVKQTDGSGKEKEVEVKVAPVYSLLKYYVKDGEKAPGSLMVKDLSCIQAGGPVYSKEGQYYLYYSMNNGTASFSAPTTEIKLSDEMFSSGYNSCMSCYSSDRKNNALPAHSTLRMRTDEFKYIQCKYDMDDLPYIEHLYLGIGDTREEAYADMIGSTNAYAASEVNCNYNSYSGKWIAIGYRRTNNANYAIHDLFLYSGNNPVKEIVKTCYTKKTTKSRGKTVTTVTEQPITYRLVTHNLPIGANVISLNEGAGGVGLYLYYSKGLGSGGNVYYDANAEFLLTPIRNMAFGYGDASPLDAGRDDLAAMFGETVHGMKVFNAEAYSKPKWEYVTGVSGESPEVFEINCSTSRPMSLSYGQLPGMGAPAQEEAGPRLAPSKEEAEGMNMEFHNGDKRVMMFVDHGSGEEDNGYRVRDNASIAGSGYFSDHSVRGRLMQTK